MKSVESNDLLNFAFDILHLLCSRGKKIHHCDEIVMQLCGFFEIEVYCESLFQGLSVKTLKMKEMIVATRTLQLIMCHPNYFNEGWSHVFLFFIIVPFNPFSFS